MTTAILGAMEAEVSAIRATMTERRDETVLGTLVHRGLLEGHELLLARSGVGKVNAALATTALVLAGAHEIAFSGVAGGTAGGIAVGDVVVSTDCVQHDVDVVALGRRPGELLGEPLAWSADASLVARARIAAQASVEGSRVHLGRVASGDQFIASAERVVWIRETFDAACCEMEGAAFAQAAHRLGVPFVVVRTISDAADDDAVVDFPTFLAMAAERGLAFARHWVADAC